MFTHSSLFQGLLKNTNNLVFSPDAAGTTVRHDHENDKAYFQEQELEIYRPELFQKNEQNMYTFCNFLWLLYFWKIPFILLIFQSFKFMKKFHWNLKGLVKRNNILHLSDGFWRICSLFLFSSTLVRTLALPLQGRCFTTSATLTCLIVVC
jgi:hypothetical protein